MGAIEEVLAATSTLRDCSTEMAARRIVQSTVNWSAMAEKVSDAQRPMFNAFKLRSDSYLRKVSALPENPPAIDWSYYQQKVAIPGLVETFKAKYESLEVPYLVTMLPNRLLLS